MELLDIDEPDAIRVESTDNDISIGIDLGTTNSLVSYFDGKETKIIGDMIPSTFEIIDNKFVVGNKNSNAIRSIKRLMGKKYSDLHSSNLSKQFNVEYDENNIYILYSNYKFTPEEISAHILSKLKTQAEQNLKKEIKKVVITVPAYFDERAKNATKNAAKLAGLEVLRLLNEPTSAAFSYGLDQNNHGIYVVYDLGGGTFDISIIKLQQGVFKVIATSGDSSFGGDDIDFAIANYLLEEYNLQINNDNIKFNELLLCAQNLKEQLSSNINEAEIYFCGIKLSLALDKLHDISSPLIMHTIKIVDDCINDARVELQKIDGIILVGGSTKMPILTKLLKDKFQNLAIFNQINPDEIVARGAAIQAYNLTHKTNNLLIDILPLSLGLEVMGGIYEKVILKNTPIPCQVSKDFTTYENGQRKMLIHVLQGERELVRDCRSLAKFTLVDIKPKIAGQVVITINFSIDSDGLLTVEAINKDDNQKYYIEMKPSYGLSTEIVEKMIEESYLNAEHDIRIKKLAQLRIDAAQLISSLDSILDMDHDLLKNKEAVSIKEAMYSLENSMNNDDILAIKYRIQNLHEIAENFIERRTNYHLKNNLINTIVTKS